MPPSRDDGHGGFFSSAPPRVFAHRGLAVDAPENTLLAFAKAVELGVTHLETDVHASSDGVAILSHDPDLARLVGRDSRVEQLSAAELGQIDLGSGQSFTSLAAALEAFPETCFNIDIKTSAAAAPTIAAIRAAKAEHRVLIGSFSNSRRLAVVRELPGVATSVSSRGAVIASWAAAAGAAWLTKLVLRSVQAVQLPERVLGVSTVSRRVLDAFHASGVEVHLWTINDPQLISRLLDAGVDGIISDRADIALDVVGRR